MQLQGGYYHTRYGDKPELIKEAIAWAESGIWRNGFDKAKPHFQRKPRQISICSIRRIRQWQRFDYLAKTDFAEHSEGESTRFRVPTSW